jgi:hypothetical protein
MFSSELKKGSIEMLILSLLDAKPSHGYEIGKAIEARSGGRLTFALPTLYPTLLRMESRGLIKGRWSSPRSSKISIRTRARTARPTRKRTRTPRVRSKTGIASRWTCRAPIAVMRVRASTGSPIASNRRDRSHSGEVSCSPICCATSASPSAP